MYKRILIVFFSGTGGTQRVAEAFCLELLKRDCEVQIMSMDLLAQGNGKNSKMVQRDFDLTIMAFPVYGLDAPDPVYNWIKNSERTSDKIAVLSVSGGGEIWPNTGCRTHCCEMLESKGYTIVYEKMMVMPCNCILPMDDHLVMWLLKALPEKVSKIITCIFSGKIQRMKYKKDFLCLKITQLQKENAHNFVKKLKTNDACNGCGWCSRNCPVGNIELKDKRPEYMDKCVMCFRCVYGCPQKAIVTSSFMIIKDGFDIEAVEERMSGIELKPMNQTVRNIAWIGVKWYLEDKDDC